MTQESREPSTACTFDEVKSAATRQMRVGKGGRITTDEKYLLNEVKKSLVETDQASVQS